MYFSDGYMHIPTSSFALPLAIGVPYLLVIALLFITYSVRLLKSYSKQYIENSAYRNQQKNNIVKLSQGLKAIILFIDFDDADSSKRYGLHIKVAQRILSISVWIIILMLVIKIKGWCL